MPDPVGRFDGAALWARLGAEARAEIGAIALELVAAHLALDGADDLDDRTNPVIRAAMAAAGQLDGELMQAVLGAVPQAALSDKAGLPRLLGPVCRVCDCSEDDACLPACSWVEADLCSACAGRS